MTEDLTAADWITARTPLGTDCAVHRHRDWVPLNIHHIWPIGLGGPNTPDNRVTLCMNAHGAVHEYIRQLMLHGSPSSDWEHFGEKVRHLAIDGWHAAGRPTHGGSE